LKKHKASNNSYKNGQTHPGILQAAIVSEPATQVSLSFKLDSPLSLNDLPEPEACHFCGQVMGRKYLDFWTGRGKLALVCEDPVPAYFCPECEADAWDPGITAILYSKAASKVREAGWASEADYFERESNWLVLATLNKASQEPAVAHDDRHPRIAAIPRVVQRSTASLLAQQPPRQQAANGRRRARTNIPGKSASTP
jgi:YgiT-type zinc finger domain-containing protein